MKAWYPALAVAALVLGSCVPGPNFKPPTPPGVKGYTPEKVTKTVSAKIANGAAQRFVANMAIPGEWWKLFHSPALDTLIAEALKANSTLAAAQATLREAQENVAADKGLLYPEVNGNLSQTREKISSAVFGGHTKIPPLTLSTASVSVSYGLPLFNTARREIEAAEAQAQYERYELEASYLTITSNVVAAAIQEASLHAQIAATDDIIEEQTAQLHVLQSQFQLGGAAQAAVLAQQATLNATKAKLPGLQKQLAQERILLTTLVGRFPSQEVTQNFTLAELHLPQKLPLSLPSKLVEQRPDIQAAQAQLHQASAQIGVAVANMLPQITLTTQYGNEVANGFGNLFNLNGPGIWTIGASLLQPIFRGGQLLHEKRAAVAAFDASAAQYQTTVIAAFQNVADTLRALQSDADALAAEVAAERTAAQSLAISRDQYRLGAINYATLLNAETTYQQAHINRVIAQANRFADTAALFQALGGGWWNRTDVASAGADDVAKAP